MCGICGVYEFGTASPSLNEALLVRMSDAIAHRGPDDARTYVSPDRRIGFGFRRLAIVDLSPAAGQPMSTPDGKITIVFNGEIYNHEVLRKEFEAKGYRYRSRSDTESILYAYREYGADFVHKLLGMFAIALWDDEKKHLILVRDRIGVKPLYYSVANGRIVFGSEIKAILQHPDVRSELDETALQHYLTFMVSPAPMTLFKGIEKLQPGHRLILRQDGTVLSEQYWHPLPQGPQPTIDIDGTPVPESSFVRRSASATEDQHAEAIGLLLRQSVKDRMMSDVPFGVFLSGGVDSSTNVALMAQLMNRPVNTFSVGYKEYEKHNELHHARLVAGTFATNHHEILIDRHDAFEFLPKLVHHQDEPLADPVCIPLYFVSKLARQNGTIVVQIGEGSDELFAGYQSMRRDLMFHDTVWKLYVSLPESVRRTLYGAARTVLRPFQRLLMLEYVRKATEGNELFWGGAISFTETHKRLMLNHRLAESDTAHKLVGQWHQEVLSRLPQADYLQRMIAVEFRNRLPELLLMRVDKMTMAASVEGRDPFLDHRLVEYALRIPSGLKIKGGVTKYILKKAIRKMRLVPDFVLDRPKQGFSTPVYDWLRTEWKEFLRERVLSSPLMQRGLFRTDVIGAMIDRRVRRNVDHDMPLWNLLNLVLWYDHWIEGKQ